MLSTLALAFLASFLAVTCAQQTEWGQCGGIGWTGATTCVAPFTCVATNEYYSQCIPGAVSSSSSVSVTSSIPVSSSSVTSTATSASSTIASTTTSSAASATGTQIRADQDPVYHFYLQNQDGVPVLGPEDTAGNFVIDGTITTTATTGSTLYLNADESATTSYKALTLDSTATTTDWGLEGDTIITTNPRQLNFLACETSDPNVWSIYLQEGSDVPSGQTCTDYISLHLPCLC